jgi:hypothetical protein
MRKGRNRFNVTPHCKTLRAQSAACHQRDRYHIAVPGIVPPCPQVQPQGRVMADGRDYFRNGLFAAMFALGLPVAQASAATIFDGAWNVRITSSSETCGNGATVAIGISNGQVASSSAVVSASGRVADAGTISVTLSSGVKRAIGFGHLSGTSGSGTWRGVMCTGSWTAEKL